MIIKILSWNINGFRAAIKKGFWEKVDQIGANIICLQETKSDSEIMLSEIVTHPNYSMVFHSCSMKKGYSGVATLCRGSGLQTIGRNEHELSSGEDIFGQGSELVSAISSSPIILANKQIGLGIEKFDVEGRIVVTKYKVVDSDLTFTILNGYFPQGGRGPERIEYKIEFYNEVYRFADKLRKSGEKVIICGDLNTTVGDIDLARPKENRKTTGCLLEEREALDIFLKNGFVDSFRHFYPELGGKYSYWDQITRARERNVGWRIDYFLVDELLLPYLKKAYIMDEIMGSDHCPVAIDLEVG